MPPECSPNNTDVIKHTTMRFSDQKAGDPLHENEDTTVMMGDLLLEERAVYAADGCRRASGNNWYGGVDREDPHGHEGTLSLAPEEQAMRRQTLV